MVSSNPTPWPTGGRRESGFETEQTSVPRVTVVLSRAVFWADPATAQEVFLELIGIINDHTPETITAWLIAACTGLAARRPGGSPTGKARSLAEAVSARVHADDNFRGRLIRAAEEATEAQQATYPEEV